MSLAILFYFLCTQHVSDINISNSTAFETAQSQAPDDGYINVRNMLSTVHKKWNKIASGIELVFYSSTITVMHGPLNMR